MKKVIFCSYTGNNIVAHVQLAVTELCAENNQDAAEQTAEIRAKLT